MIFYVAVVHNFYRIVEQSIHYELKNKESEVFIFLFKKKRMSS